MGNAPSSNSKSGHSAPTSSSASHSNSNPTTDSPRAHKKDHKNLVPGIHGHHHQHVRLPASPEASGVQAQGSTISNRTSQSRPLSILHSSSPSTSINASPAHNTPWQPPEPKHVAQDISEHSKPVAVPQITQPEPPDFPTDAQYEELPTVTTSSSIQDMSYHLSRPPRLPLPIEEEIHTPGSPIAAPTSADDGDLDDVSALDEQTGLPRRASGLSNVTDEDDAEELRVDKTRPHVPIKIQWLRGGNKVYVTGTPFQWSRKQRMYPAKDRENVLETTISVFPGTHHIKFLVDGSMQTSPDLPTTVDFGNNLVNYIEAVGEDATAGNLHLDIQAPRSDNELAGLLSRQPSMLGDEKPQTKVIEPVESFSGKLPSYLEDFDQPEDSTPYKLSASALEKLPAPPSLPGFLSKPIMNNTTLMKDDNSVLNMPNHTVLNHLATCSIKNNVLAVSATTRYQNKYVTTIVYKATKE
ncbi:carbohydrate-binding module family 48 protein [Xylariaceae sp. FL0016]|nr:carbohydrate-binding module family 48 protein [Xylariaceae sp. FL0016]